MADDSEDRLSTSEGEDSEQQSQHSASDAESSEDSEEDQDNADEHGKRPHELIPEHIKDREKVEVSSTIFDLRRVLLLCD